MKSVALKSKKTKQAKFSESPAQRAARAKKIIALLHKTYSDADCALTHKSAWDLLVATILSAQCTDVRVNMVTPVLFAKYKTVQDMAGADPAAIEEIIKSTGFFRNKAKSILGAAKMLIEKFGGQVPDTMEELLQLPGVARKTANVVLGTWFEKNDGVVVDTHVGRLAHRLKLSWRSAGDKDAKKIEIDLMEVLPRDEWTFTSHALIWHGRKVCIARKPACERCELSDVCPSAFTFDNPKATKAGAISSAKPARRNRGTDKASNTRPRR